MVNKTCILFDQCHNNNNNNNCLKAPSREQYYYDLCVLVSMKPRGRTI